MADERDDLPTQLDFEKYAAYASSAKSVDPWSQATGLRTNALRFQTLTFGGGGERLAETFLINSRLIRGDVETSLSIQSYFTDVSSTLVSLNGTEVEPQRAFLLPPSAQMTMPLRDVFALRRTVRSYTGDPAAFAYIAAILRAAAGITAQTNVPRAGGSQATIRFRTTPSGGGLYPIDVYLVAYNVRQLPPAIYRYRPVDDDLVLVADADVADRLRGAFAMPDDMLSLSRAAAVFLLVARPWRSMRKYGDRGMRFVFQEAGAIAEHINLACAALGLGSADCASVYEDEVHEILGIDGLFTSLIHTVVAGTPA